MAAVEATHWWYAATPRCCNSSPDPRSPRAAASSMPAAAPAPRGPGWGAGRARGQRRPSGRPLALRTSSCILVRRGRRRRPGVALPRLRLRRRAVRHRALPPLHRGPGRRRRRAGPRDPPGRPRRAHGARRAAAATGPRPGDALRSPVLRGRPPAAAVAAGLDVSRATGAYSFLVPPATAKTLLERGRSTSDLDRHGSGLGGLLGGAAALERRVLRRVSLPAGLSVVVVARRP